MQLFHPWSCIGAITLILHGIRVSLFSHEYGINEPNVTTILVTPIIANPLKKIIIGG